MLKKSRSVLKNKNSNIIIWVFIGLISVLLFTLERLSPQFDYFIAILERPTYLAVTLVCLAGIIYLLLINKIVSSKVKTTILPLFFVGLILRLFFLQSTPIYEDDFYRYSFDGSMSYHGVNPYKYAPQDALEQPAYIHNELLGIENKSIPANPDLHFLADQPLMERVAYPDIHTIYPPVTQSIFALSYAIKPFSLITWRSILLIFEIISFVLFLKLLKHLNKPLIWSAIYWLNPLVITETMNAAHMDALLVPVLLFSLLFATKQRYSIAGAGLAIAVGIKLWPLLLIPSLFRPLIFQPKKLLKAIIPCVLVLIIVLLPQELNYADAQSGLTNYTQYWRTNSFIFGLLEDGLAYIESQVNFDYNAQALARYIIAGLIVGLVIFQLNLTTKNTNTKIKIEELSQTWLIIIACLFLLSPTGYPWYFIWFLPLLVLKPNLPLLSFTLFLPLYDLRYPLGELDNLALFDNVIIPLQFLPPVILILITIYKYKHKKSPLLK